MGRVQTLIISRRCGTSGTYSYLDPIVAQCVPEADLQKLGHQAVKYEGVPNIVLGVLPADAEEVRVYLNRYPNTEIFTFKTKGKTAQVTVAFEKAGYRILMEEPGLISFERQYNKKLYQNKSVLGAKDTEEWLDGEDGKVKDLPKGTEVNLEIIQAHDLLCHERYDISFKLLYGRLKMAGLARRWREELYEEHIRRITGAGDEIKEYGKKKEGLSVFLNEFHRLLAPVDHRLIPAIPIDKSGVPQDGSHRIAAAILMNRPIRCVRLPIRGKCLADLNFFVSKNKPHPPMPSDKSEAALLEFIKNNPKAAVALIFPTVFDNAGAFKLLKTAASVVYSKRVQLGSREASALLRQAYDEQEWKFGKQRAENFQNKVKSCFPGAGEVTVVCLDGVNLGEIRSVKEQIREKYKFGKHSVHIGDSHRETVQIARAVLNKNSLDMLMAGIQPSERFHQMLIGYREWLEEEGLDPEVFCLGGSAVLGLMGLRVPNDLDYLSAALVEAKGAPPNKVSTHNHMTNFYPIPISDIVGDPNMHFWYMGVKFCSVDIILKFKKKRGEGKDIRDCYLIESKIKKSRLKVFDLFLDKYSWAKWKMSQVKQRLKSRWNQLSG